MAQLPEVFRPCFWDTDFDGLDTRKDSTFIIIRLYTMGGFRGIRWAEENYPKESIIRAAKTRRDLNPLVANYLKEKYGIKKEEMAYYQMQGTLDWIPAPCRMDASPYIRKGKEQEQMADKNFLDKAKENLRVATVIKEQMWDDTAYRDHIGFHLVQAVEMCLIHQLKMKEVSLPFLYNVAELIRMGRQEHIELTLTDYVTSHVDMLCLWKDRIETVYDDPIGSEEIEEAMAGVKEFLELVERKEDGR